MRIVNLAATASTSALIMAGAGWSTLGASADALPAMPSDVNIAKGEALYSANCASCHGADLEGQADWRSPGPDGRLPAPPHDETGHTWHHSDNVLFQYTKLGGHDTLAMQGVEFDSGMPGFANQLTDQEIWNILAFIKSTWPEREREVQAARTKAGRADNGS